jgi:hypothetical protein
MILDLANKRGKSPRLDWEVYIKDEFHRPFFERLRETYNYLKHADTDADVELAVHDITSTNILALFIAITNYIDLFEETTDHMRFFSMFVMNLIPEMVVACPETQEFKSAISSLENMTPHDFFKTFEDNIGSLPNFAAEEAEDTKDVIDYYHLSFTEIRAGETKSRRIFRIKED